MFEQEEIWVIELLICGVETLSDEWLIFTSGRTVFTNPDEANAEVARRGVIEPRLFRWRVARFVRA